MSESYGARGPESLTSHRAFMQLWFARLCGTSAMQMLMVAVGWQMYELTGSAWDLGLVGLYQFAPALALTLLAGHVADRHHRGRIVAVCFVLQLGAALVLMDAAFTDRASRGLLLGVSLVLGAARAFQLPAQQALTPLLVPLPLLSRALAFSAAGAQMAIIGGPALGGLIFTAGAAAVYGTCVGLLAVGAVLLAMIRYPRAAPPKEPASLRALLAGVGFVWREKAILGAISLDLFAVLFGGATALLPMFAKDILHVGPAGFGLLRAAPAVGALAMSIFLSHTPLERRIGLKLMAAVATYGLCMLVFGVSTSLALSLAALAISGGADMVSVVVRQTMVQMETPDHMRGRVGAVNSVFMGASNQLGEFESGATAALLGPVGSVVLGGAATLLVAALWLRLFPSLVKRDRFQQR